MKCSRKLMKSLKASNVFVALVKDGDLVTRETAEKIMAPERMFGEVTVPVEGADKGVVHVIVLAELVSAVLEFTNGAGQFGQDVAGKMIMYGSVGQAVIRHDSRVTKLL